MRLVYYNKREKQKLVTSEPRDLRRMIILGVDPGTATTGYGLIETCDDSEAISLLGYGCITTSSDRDMASRLHAIFDEMQAIIDAYKPDVMAVEELFVCANLRTAMTVGQARGVVILAAACNGVGMVEYTPLAVKSAVTGYGRADKAQVQYMVKALLNLDNLPRPNDAADALAVAICHANRLYVTT